MDEIDFYPLVLLALGIGIIVVLIVRLRVHAFLALITAALVVGLLSPSVVLVAPRGATEPELQLARAPELVGRAFGNLMGRIGIAIALATIIGKALLDSGGADRIVRFITRLFGQQRAPWALLVSGFVLGIPVFFDTVFLLLVPLAKALGARTGRDYLLYVMAIGAGATITHSLVPPTPGPISMAEVLRVDLGLTIIVGILVGAPLSLIGFGYATILNRLWPVPLRQSGDVSLTELEKRVQVADSQLPPLWLSALPIVLPAMLITALTIYEMARKLQPELDVSWEVNGLAIRPFELLRFLGNASFALLLATVVAMLLVVRQKKMSWGELGKFTGTALDEAGTILLITCAGGAFGSMLETVGVGTTINLLARSLGIPLLVLAWLLAALFKFAQGSATVAMITTAQILMAILTAELRLAYPGQAITVELLAAHLGYHPVYLVMMVGAGSKVGSWMNDSGFWVVGKMSSMTEAETLRSWTVMLLLMGCAGLPLIWLLTLVIPLV